MPFLITIKKPARLFTRARGYYIIKTADGPGAGLWGLLKSYEAEGNGWIPLDKEYVEVL